MVSLIPVLATRWTLMALFLPFSQDSCLGKKQAVLCPPLVGFCLQSCGFRQFESLFLLMQEREMSRVKSKCKSLSWFRSWVSLSLIVSLEKNHEQEWGKGKKKIHSVQLDLLHWVLQARNACFDLWPFFSFEGSVPMFSTMGNFKICSFLCPCCLLHLHSHLLWF